MTVTLPPAERQSGPASPEQQRRRRVPSFLVRLFWQIALLAVLVVIWQEAVDHNVLTTLAVSKPTDVWSELRTLGDSTVLWSNILVTLEETLIGYVLGVVVGALAGFGLSFLPKVLRILNPYVTVLNSIPRLALGPLFILWFGIGLSSKVALVFSLVVFIIFTNVVAGVRSVDSDIVSMSHLLGAGRRQILTKVMLPATFPWLVAGMRLSIAYAISGAVVGEMFASQSGIGNLITAGSGLFNTAEIFAALIVIAVIAAILDALGRYFEGKILRWRPEIELG
jgi:NitT/TauT family transport system permease protein